MLIYSSCFWQPNASDIVVFQFTADGLAIKWSYILFHKMADTTACTKVNSCVEFSWHLNATIFWCFSDSATIRLSCYRSKYRSDTTDHSASNTQLIVVMLSQRSRRWTNVKREQCQSVVFVGYLRHLFGNTVLYYCPTLSLHIHFNACTLQTRDDETLLF